MDKKFHLTLYQACDYLSMLGLKLNHASERGPWSLCEFLNEIFVCKIFSFCTSGLCHALHSLLFQKKIEHLIFHHWLIDQELCLGRDSPNECCQWKHRSLSQNMVFYVFVTQWMLGISHKIWTYTCIFVIYIINVVNQRVVTAILLAAVFFDIFFQSWPYRKSRTSFQSCCPESTWNSWSMEMFLRL